jgi:hypothetical protein
MLESASRLLKEDQQQADMVDLLICPLFSRSVNIIASFPSSSWRDKMIDKISGVNSMELFLKAGLQYASSQK